MAVDAFEPNISLLFPQEPYGFGFSTYISATERKACSPEPSLARGRDGRDSDTVSRGRALRIWPFPPSFWNHNVARSSPFS